MSVHQSATSFSGNRVGYPSIGQPHRSVRGQRAGGVFFATIQQELLDRSTWPDRAAARTAIFDFVEGWYNWHRLHSSLGYRGPAEYETARAT